MPRILIATRVFAPELHATALMVRQLATRLARDGWAVDVVTGFPSYPLGVVHDGYRRASRSTEEMDGFRVHRVWHPVGPPGRVLRRVGEVGCKTIFGVIRSLALQPPDVILTVGAPLLGALAWFPAAWRARAHLVNVVYDLYPDIAIESGHLRSPGLIRAASLIERMHWRAADTHVVLSKGFRLALLERGVPDERIAVIPVWIDTTVVTPLSRDNLWRREHGIAVDKLVMLYAGTIGVVSGGSVVADAAALLRERRDILFLFVGEGVEKARAEVRCQELGLSNVKFLPFQPAERLAELQATADVGFVTLAPGQGRTSVPSKVLGYMAAGRPVLASVDPESDTAREIAEGEFGVVVPPGDPRHLAEAVTALADDEPARRRMGEAARRRVVACNDVNSVLSAYVQLLDGLARGKGRR